MTKDRKNSVNQKIRFLWQVVAPFRRRAFLVLALMLIDSALASIGIGMILPVLQTVLTPASKHIWLMQMIPGLAALSPNNRILVVAGTTLIIFTVKFIIGLLYVRLTRDFAERMRTYWCDRIGQHNLYGPYANIVRQKQGVLLNNWLQEPLSANKFFITYMKYLSALVLTLALFTLGLAVNWQAMGAFVVLAGLILFILKRRSFGAAAEQSRLKLGLNQQLSTSLTASLAHLKDIKILTAEPDRLTQMRTILQRLRSLLVRMAVLSELPRLLGEFLAVAALVTVLAATTFVEGFAITKMLPMLAFFFIASYRLITASTLAMTSRVKALHEIHSVRLVHTLSQETGEENQHHGIPIASLDTDLHFEHVTFAYQRGRPIFTDLNLTLPRGKLIFFSGKSGSGKSTLLDLLLRLYNPQAGYIMVNDHNIGDFDLVSWRRLFGYVSQDATLFHGSISMNVRLGRPGATDHEVEEACQLAGCYDLIAGLPEGYETMVGERGLALSVGQRKRIAIARALVGKPSILILDEATTSFETEIEHNIIHALRQKRPGLTILQISHRLQTASEADVILHLEEGIVRQITTATDLPQKIPLASN